VIVPDVNLLLYAVDESTPVHTRAVTWWTEVLAGPEPVGLPWVTVLGFVRLSTNSRIFESPLAGEAAVDIVAGWFRAPHVTSVEPGPRHLGIMRELIAETGAAGNLVTDAHLAALAVENGATLVSADHDFARFAGLDCRNPLR
jgi:hypothetical protein